MTGSKSWNENCDLASSLAHKKNGQLDLFKTTPSVRLVNLSFPMLTSVEPRGFVWGIPSLFMLRSWFHLDNTPFYLQDGGQSERSSGRGYSHRTRVRGSGNRTSSGAAKRKIILPIFQREHIRRKQILFSIERKERRTPYSQRAGFDANRLPPRFYKTNSKKEHPTDGKNTIPSAVRRRAKQSQRNLQSVPA